MSLLIEVVIATAISVGAFLILPLSAQGYILIGAIVMIVGLLLTYSIAGFSDNIESAPTLVWLFWTILTTAVLGAFWPAVPLIIVWKYAASKISPEDPKAS